MTQEPVGAVPRHVAVIMDGNGRWALRRHLPRVAGHRSGVESVRAVIRVTAEQGIEVLTLFAFSSENWCRPPKEVHFLMSLFQRLLKKEVQRLHENNIQFRVIGDKSALSESLQLLIEEAETLTANNSGLKLRLAVNYGGRWDITQAVQQLALDVANKALLPSEISESHIQSYLSTADIAEPDLIIRTSGESRISNFLLWQAAYAELFFVPEYWPDFTDAVYLRVLKAFAERQRRFGKIGEQSVSA